MISWKGTRRPLQTLSREQLTTQPSALSFLQLPVQVSLISVTVSLPDSRSTPFRLHQWNACLHFWKCTTWRFLGRGLTVFLRDFGSGFLEQTLWLGLLIFVWLFISSFQQQWGEAHWGDSEYGEPVSKAVRVGQNRRQLLMPLETPKRVMSTLDNTNFPLWQLFVT